MLENGYSSREQRSGVSKPFSSNIVKVLRVNNFCPHSQQICFVCPSLKNVTEDTDKHLKTIYQLGSLGLSGVRYLRRWRQLNKSGKDEMTLQP